MPIRTARTIVIFTNECKKIGLNVTPLEADQGLQDLVLTVHHCYMHALMNTPSHKIIENHKGVAFVKQIRLATLPGAG